jgi:hypothetical protein
MLTKRKACPLVSRQMWWGKLRCDLEEIKDLKCRVNENNLVIKSKPDGKQLVLYSLWSKGQKLSLMVLTFSFLKHIVLGLYFYKLSPMKIKILALASYLSGPVSMVLRCEALLWQHEVVIVRSKWIPQWKMLWTEKEQALNLLLIFILQCKLISLMNHKVWRANDCQRENSSLKRVSLEL